MDDGRMKERREGEGVEKGGEDTVWRGGGKTRDGEKKNNNRRVRIHENRN